MSGNGVPPTPTKRAFATLPGDITYTISREMLKGITFEIDSSEKFITVHYDDVPGSGDAPAWPSIDIARRGDVLVAVDGRSTLIRKSYPRILAYLNEMRNRRAYELTFRLPQVALDARPAVSTRTFFDSATGNCEGYLNKLSKGGLFSKPKWEVRYFVLHSASRELRRYHTRADVSSKKVDVIKLSDVTSITEAVEQPEPEEGVELSAASSNGKLITRFDLLLRDGSRRPLITFNPEDCRVWVSRISTLIKQVVMTTEPCDEIVEEVNPAPLETPKEASPVTVEATVTAATTATATVEPVADAVDVAAVDVSTVDVVEAVDAEEVGEAKSDTRTVTPELPDGPTETAAVAGPSFTIVTPARKATSSPAVKATPIASPPQPWATDDANPTGASEPVKLPDIADLVQEGDGSGDDAAAEGDKPKKAGKKKTKTGKKKAAPVAGGEASKPKKTMTTATAAPKKTAAAATKPAVIDKAAVVALAAQVGTAKDIRALARELRRR